MNCEQARRALLLAQSDELAPGRRAGLDTHLETCPDCRSYRADLARMLIAARNAPLDCGVGEAALRRIEDAAARGVRPVGTARGWMTGWHPALAAAAAAVVVLAAAGRFLPSLRGGEDVAGGADTAPAALLQWDAGLDEQVESLHTLLAMVVEEGESPENGESLDSLAAELIELESWSI